MSTAMRLGYVGLGLMGTEMVRRLREKGWAVTVWNLEPERVPPMIEIGAVAADSPAAVCAASDVVLMCVLHTQAVESCVFGENGIAGTARPGQILVDHSTADPAKTAEMAARLKRETGMGWVDAPVSGGTVAAREGTMTVMAGGDSADVEAVRPVMADLAAHYTHMGPVGAGQTAKMINQAIVGTTYVLMAEALALAEASGIEAARLPQCLQGGHADGSLLQQLYPRMQARDFDPPRAFARQLLKDVHAVEAFVAGLGLDLPLIQAAVKRHEAWITPERAMLDPASLIRLYDRK